MATNKKDRIPFHEEFAEKIIKMLEEGTAPWQKPWTPAQNMAPRNPLSGTVYRGVNRLHLAMQGYADPRWMTLKLATASNRAVAPRLSSTTSSPASRTKWTKMDSLSWEMTVHPFVRR